MKRLLAYLLPLMMTLALSGCLSSPKQLPPDPPVVESPLPPEPAPAPPEPPPPPPRPPQVSIEPAQVLQGDFATLRLDRPVSGAVTVAVEGLGEQPKLFDRHGLPAAFIGFPAAAKVGEYPVTVTWPDGSWSGSITVVKKTFTEDYLWVTAQQEALYYDPRSAEQWRRVFALRSTSHPEPLWQGPFALPLAGELKITTYFGEIRFVNGAETGRHSGMDFGAPTGTPILAPAPGKVIFAEPMITTGDTVIIDHGLNLFTAYYHMDQLAVKAGQWLGAGEEIGTVGNTGFSTGPHLHWTATIGNTPVDPWPLTAAPPLGIQAPAQDWGAVREQ